VGGQPRNGGGDAAGIGNIHLVVLARKPVALFTGRNVEDVNFGAVPDQGAGDRLPNAARAAGHDRNASPKIQETAHRPPDLRQN
jgi:hypothetical protein